MNPLAENNSDEYQQVYASALRLLVRREHSVQELFHKLKGRQFCTQTVEQVIEVLIEEDALSDRRFTEIYVRNRFEKGFGPVRIRTELRDRGIGDRLVEAALEDYADEWVAQAQRQRCKRFGELIHTEFNERVRQMRFLEQRGFSSEQIRRSMRAADDA